MKRRIVYLLIAVLACLALLRNKIVGGTLLWYAISSGRAQAAILLMDVGTSLGSRSWGVTSALMHQAT